MFRAITELVIVGVSNRDPCPLMSTNNVGVTPKLSDTVDRLPSWGEPLKPGRGAERVPGSHNHVRCS